MPRMTQLHRVDIVGVGDDGWSGLSSAAQQVIERAGVVIGATRLLDLLPQGRREQLDPGNSLDALVEAIQARSDRHVVVLTSGDPLFFGVARFLCEHLGKDQFNVLPHVSSMQLAFARVKESWDEAYLANLDTVSLDRAIDRIRVCEKAGLFTSPNVSPADVARRMLARGIDYFTGYVCENLGSPDERVTCGELPELKSMTFSTLNVMVLVRKPGRPEQADAEVRRRAFGYDDECFRQSLPKRGLLTRMEIRVLAIAALDLQLHSVLWDVGAGSGSVAIEASAHLPHGRVYAIEMDPADHDLIAINCQRFGVDNITPVLGQAPEVWSQLPDPDAIFVGGTGRNVAGIVESAWERLRPEGHMVMNVGSVESLADVLRVLRARTDRIHVRMIQVADGVDQMDSLRFESRPPTYLVHATRAA